MIFVSPFREGWLFGFCEKPFPCEFISPFTVKRMLTGKQWFGISIPSAPKVTREAVFFSQLMREISQVQ